MEYKVTVIMPVFNETFTIYQIIEKVLQQDIIDELIIVDDCSYDGTREKLEKLNTSKFNKSIKIFYHSHNLGKASAVRTGLKHCTGNIIILQDADLEYDPNDYNALVSPIKASKVDLVNGSRFLISNNIVRVMTFKHVLKNKAITMLCNIINNIYITDLTSCYKAFHIRILDKIQLTSFNFVLETELISKVAAANFKICEVPISYNYRTKLEGKKITFYNGIECVLWLLNFAFYNKIWSKIQNIFGDNDMQKWKQQQLLKKQLK